MAEEDIKNLPPAERIKKLKGLEKKKKKEIEEAQEILRETERELTEEEEWKRKIPIPEVTKEQVEEMSEAEKEIIKAHKDLREKREEAVGEEEELPRSFRHLSLEETVARERAELPPELMENEYTTKLSQEPMENIYQEVRDIYQAVNEKGYVSPEEERRIGHLSAATERKLEDIEAGKYSLTEEVAREALLTRRMGEKLKDIYRRGEEENE